MEMNQFGIVELAAIVGTCVIALATFVFMKDKSVRDELAEQRRWTHDEIMRLSNTCVKREEIQLMLTTMRQDIQEIRTQIGSVVDKLVNKS